MARSMSPAQARRHAENTSPKKEKERQENNGPAAEKRRADNAWHTNPLAPMPYSVIKNHARSMMNTIYKPAFASLNSEEKQLQSIDEKRKADNSYYLNWLESNNANLEAHSATSQAQLVAAQGAAQTQLQQGFQAMQAQLVNQGQNDPGTVSNMGEANAFDLGGAQQKASREMAGSNLLVDTQLQNTNELGDVARANNFATIAGNEAKRMGDLWEGMSKLGNRRQELRLTKAAEAAKEVARLMDAEVSKGQIRGQMSASRETAALEAKRFGLDVNKLHQEGREFEYEKFNDTRTAKQKREENAEDNTTGENKSKRTRSGTAETNERAEGENAEEAGEKKAKAHKENAKITSSVQEGISYITSHSRIRELIANGQTEKARKVLAKYLGSSTAATYAVNLYGGNKLTAGEVKEAEELYGWTPPRSYRE